MAEERETGRHFRDAATAHLRIVEIERRAADGGASVDDALHEMRVLLEERLVAEEELRAQSVHLEESVAALIEERQRYRDLFEQAPVAYLVTDLDGLITDCNGMATRILDVPYQWLIGKPLAMFVDDDSHELWRWITQLRERRRPAAGEVRLKPHAGDPIESVVTVAAVHTDGQPTALRWVVAPGSAPQPTEPTQPPPAVRFPGPLPAETVLPERAVRVFVLTDNELFVRGLEMLLGTVLGRPAELVRSGDGGDHDHLSDVLRFGPELVLVSLDRDEDERIDLIRRLGADHPDLPVLCLVDDENGRLARRVLANGAAGVLPVASDPAAMVGPLLAVMDGWSVLPEELTTELISNDHRRTEVMDRLDDEERAIWLAVAEGRHDVEIAEALHVSTRTAKRRVAGLFEKLGVDNRVQAAGLAGRLGLIS